ncbi:hypothetical protein, partial [Mesorhizobium mediterraneum]|uniref:hypothetical protein n=1 Tax=Mesorhizobium mediterraneum TaxID=43617 RepID=UPI003D7EB65B
STGSCANEASTASAAGKRGPDACPAPSDRTGASAEASAKPSIGDHHAAARLRIGERQCLSTRAIAGKTGFPAKAGFY